MKRDRSRNRIFAVYLESSAHKNKTENREKGKVRSYVRGRVDSMGSDGLSISDIPVGKNKFGHPSRKK